LAGGRGGARIGGIKAPISARGTTLFFAAMQHGFEIGKKCGHRKPSASREIFESFG
jgi:hypothetical protein